MGPLFKASALCLVALCGLQSATAGTLKFNVDDVTDDAYTILNLARNGQLPVKINELKKSSTITQTLKEALAKTDDSAVSGSACASLVIGDAIKNSTFYVEYDKSAAPSYATIVQKALDAGLAISQLQTYPSSWNGVWGDNAGAALARLLWSESEQVGCATGVCATTSEASNRAFLFCQMTPAATQNNAPFTKEYYEGLKQRKTLLKDMKEDDLNVSAGGSVIAVPSVLLASLVAIMATIAA